jgi:hypothetical protein
MTMMMRQAATILFAAAIACAAAGAGTSATKKQIAITITPASETFQLSLSSAGSVVRDAGNVIWTTAHQRILTRDGQRVRVWTGTGRFVGKRGQLVMRLRWEWLNAGRDYEAGIGTWSVTNTTGSYAALNGSGKGAAVWLPGRPVASRLDGFVQEG